MCWIGFNTLRPRQNSRHLADDLLKCISLNENVRILIKISLRFVTKGPNNNITALVEIMAWRRPGDKPLSEPMMVRLPTHIYASLGLNELTNTNMAFCITQYRQRTVFGSVWNLFVLTGIENQTMLAQCSHNYRRLLSKHGPILINIAFSTTITNTEHRSDFVLTKGTPNLKLMGESLDV